MLLLVWPELFHFKCADVFACVTVKNILCWAVEMLVRFYGRCCFSLKDLELAISSSHCCLRLVLWYFGSGRLGMRIHFKMAWGLAGENILLGFDASFLLSLNIIVKHDLVDDWLSGLWCFPYRSRNVLVVDSSWLPFRRMSLVGRNHSNWVLWGRWVADLRSTGCRLTKVLPAPVSLVTAAAYSWLHVAVKRLKVEEVVELVSSNSYLNLGWLV